MNKLEFRMEVMAQTTFKDKSYAKTVTVPSSVDMKITVELPFMPTLGMHVEVIEGDDFRKVHDIYWSKKDGYEIYFEPEDMWTVEELQTVGWEVVEDEE